MKNDTEQWLAAYAAIRQRVAELPPMTEAEKREQAASWACGQMALMREYRDASPEKLAELRALCRRVAGCEE